MKGHKQTEPAFLPLSKESSLETNDVLVRRISTKERRSAHHRERERERERERNGDEGQGEGKG